MFSKRQRKGMYNSATFISPLLRMGLWETARLKGEIVHLTKKGIRKGELFVIASGVNCGKSRRK